MKKSGQVGLVLLAALGLASCSSRRGSELSQPSSQATMTWDDRPRDPCSQEFFDQNLCQGAVTNRGYHYGGHWYPMIYSSPYSHYYDRHQSFLSQGGRYTPTPVEVYSPGFKAPAKGEVVRGGFGATAKSYSSSSSHSTGSSSGASSHATSSSSSSGS